MKRDPKGRFTRKNFCVFRDLYEPGFILHVIKDFGGSDVAHVCCFCGVAWRDLDDNEYEMRWYEARK
jgi:hypothetical protein